MLWETLACAGSGASETGVVYAMGDLHGDLDNAVAAAHLAGFVDEDGHWVGGAATFVQTGDMVDRGPDSGAVLAWLRRLTAEAEKAGGRVHVLLGNHEVMNLQGDWRYVSAGDVAAYGGLDARRAAFSVNGPDGAWLRTRDAAVKVGETVFVHGGIRDRKDLDALNAEVRSAIDVPAAPILGPGGPLWYRGYVTDPEATACPILARTLRDLGARRMVVGHTTRTDGAVQTRCGGALVVIDIGISDAYGSHLGALVLDGRDARAIYPSGPVDLPDP